MKIQVLGFGIVKEIFSSSSIVQEVPEQTTVFHLKQELERQFPEIKKLRSYFIAVNQEYAGDHVEIASTDEIAVIPPVSGG